jgi:biopolymer transport protein ExbD
VLNIPKPIVTINLTPLIDVSLVLVVVFIGMAPWFIKRGLALLLNPVITSAAAVAVAPIKKIFVRLDKQGLWLGAKRVNEAEMGASLSHLVKQGGRIRVVFTPSRTVSHGEMVSALDQIKRSGVESVLIQGEVKP